MERHGVKTVSGVMRYFVGSLLLISTFLSCGGSRLRVAYGNYKYAQGEYGQATISYIRALKSAEAGPTRARDRSVLYYNLGNVYHALGETISATNTLSRAVSAGDWDELESRANFNLGNIYYELGHYDRAAEHYIASLVADPNDIDAKINLELVLKRMSGEAESEIEVQAAKPLSERYQKMLQLIQRREEKTWRSTQKESSEESNLAAGAPQDLREDW